MTRELTSIEEAQHQHAAIQEGFRRNIDALSTEILKFEPRNTAGIRLLILKLDEQVRQFHRDFAGLTKAQMKARADGRDEDQDGPGRDSPEWASLMARVNLTRVAVNSWHDIRPVIEAQAEPYRSALFYEAPEQGDIVGAQMAELGRLITQLNPVLNPAEQNDTAHSQGAFSDVPLPHQEFLANLHAAYRLRLAQDQEGPSYFIDIGCGGGIKVFQAARFFERAFGIDLDPGYITAAERIFEATERDNARVLQHDALTFPSYDEFHILYFYRPIRHRELLFQLEQKIAADARHGAILIAPYEYFIPVAEDLGCVRVGESVYIKGYSKEDAAALVARAELTGPMINPPLPPLMHLWEPLLRASCRRGFGLTLRP
ncbi:MAG: class I SAM-dependent methyltransferase [Pseudomonadota bacterium]